MLLPLPRAMALAADDLPDWGEADDVPQAVLPHLEDAHEHGSPLNKLHVKRVEMLNTQKEEKSDTQQEVDASMASYERQLSQVRDSFDPSSPRTQTDLSDAVPRLVFMDHPSDELYWPILNSPDLAYKLYPVKLRLLLGAEDESTGLIQDDRYRPADTYANDHPTWVPDYPDSHSTSLVDYDVLAQWLA